MVAGVGELGQGLGEPLFSFVIAGRPLPWARAVPVEGGMVKKKPQRAFARTVADYARIEMLQRRVKVIARPDAVALGVRIYLDAPKSWERSDPEEWARAQARSWCIDRPDLDNWLKLPMDALNGLAYLDDGQVVCFPHTGKWYDPGRPRLEVDVWRIPR